VALCVANRGSVLSAILYWAMSWCELFALMCVKDNVSPQRQCLEVGCRLCCLGLGWVIAMWFPSKTIVAFTLLALFVVPLQSWAVDSQLVYATVDGAPISESLVLGAMLCKRQSVRSEPYNLGVAIAGLQDALPPAGVDGVWTYASYSWGGGFLDGHFNFRGFNGDLPKSFRVAVYRPAKDQIYISNEVKVHSLLNRYQLDVCDDGTAVLTRDDTGRWLADTMLGIAACGLTFTVLLALCMECLVVAIGVLVMKQKPVLFRVVASCALLNLFAGPIIWGLCHLAIWAGGLWWGLGLLAVELSLAILFESAAYSLIGRFGLRSGFGLALVANVTAIAFLFLVARMAFV